ncbi:MAG: phage tail assembly protein [Campylobacteraceae bacterium]|nr:phage tail assembly protein [Campylobacteraceae bacterium]
MARSKTIKLKIADKEVTIHAPTVGVIVEASENNAGEVKQGISVAARCCNMTESEIKALDISDFNAIQAVITGFLGNAAGA